MKTSLNGLKLFVIWLIVWSQHPAFSQDLEKEIIDAIDNSNEKDPASRQKLIDLGKEATLRLAEMLRKESDPQMEITFIVVLVRKYDQLYAEFSETERETIVRLIVDKTRDSSGRFLRANLGALQSLDHPLVTALATELKATVTEPRTVFAVDSLMKRIAERAHPKTGSSPSKKTHVGPVGSQKEQPPEARTVATVAVNQGDQSPARQHWWYWAAGAAVLSGLAWLFLKRRSPVR